MEITGRKHIDWRESVLSGTGIERAAGNQLSVFSSSIQGNRRTISPKPVFSPSHRIMTEATSRLDVMSLISPIHKPSSGSIGLVIL
jgi:hypothetical protein